MRTSADTVLEAHGTGTALGDPIEIGAAIDALCQVEEGSAPEGNGSVLCTSVKALTGHLEAAAAAAGLSSLVAVALKMHCVGPNAALRVLNEHLYALVSRRMSRAQRGNLHVSAEVVSRVDWWQWKLHQQSI